MVTTGKETRPPSLSVFESQSRGEYHLAHLREHPVVYISTLFYCCVICTSLTFSAAQVQRVAVTL